MQVASGVYCFRGRPGEPLRRGAGSANVIAIRGEATALVDAGVVVGGALAGLLAAARAERVALPERLAWILLTHCHWDHINAAGQLCRRSGARLGAGVADAPLVEDAQRNFAAFVARLGAQLREITLLPPTALRLLGRFTFGAQPRLHVDRALRDGDAVDIGRRVEVLALPGHTRGHLGFFVPDAGVLGIGDLIDFENAFGLDLNNVESDYEAGVASLRRVRAIDPEVLICGHGEAAVGSRAAGAVIDRALSAALDFPDRVRATLGRQPRRLAEIAARAFPADGFVRASAARTLSLALLLHLERRCEVHSMVHGGRPAWIRRD